MVFYFIKKILEGLKIVKTLHMKKKNSKMDKSEFINQKAQLQCLIQ